MHFSVFYPVGWYSDKSPSLKFLYDRAIDTAKIAEELGFYSIFFNEGHALHPNYKLPNPRLLIAACAQHTSRLYMGTGVIGLGIQNPRFIAEDAAMLDALTGGRFLLGIGSGNPLHYAEFGLSAGAKRDIYDFKRKILEAFLEGKTVNTNVELFRAIKARLAILPEYPDFRSRMLQGTVSADGAKAIGESGWGMIFTPKNSPGRSIKDLIPNVRAAAEAYKEGWKLSAHASEPAPLPMIHLPCHIADTEGQAREQIADHWDRYQKALLYAIDVGDSGPKLPPHLYYDLYANDGASLFGTVEKACERIEAVRNAGIPHILCLFNIGGIEHDDMVKVMRRFAKDVMPRFADLKEKAA